MHSDALEKIRRFALEMREDMVADASDSIYSFHMADSATSSTERERIARLIQHLQDTIKRIEAALKRIKDGTYGFCRITGKPIDRERLEAIPYTDVSREALLHPKAKRI
ncbi:MAG: molecular chaperone DnaK [Calditrichaeota bacterium]|nr:MAG: molecular chaperone DnaK [Calditrichota bacterium]